jgi:periplasmic divalent cation tolerance protein
MRNPCDDRGMQAEATNEFCFLYSTFPNTNSAEAVARALVDAKLAACVNIHSPMTSFYVWQGKREEEREVAAFIKTRRNLVDAVIRAARPLHPYTTPCFLVLPIEAGNGDYLAWARAQTEQGTDI